jgi:hypothetical protein
MKLAPMLAASAALLFTLGAAAQEVKPCKPAPQARAQPGEVASTQQATRTENTVEAQKGDTANTPQMADSAACEAVPPAAR